MKILLLRNGDFGATRCGCFRGELSDGHYEALRRGLRHHAAAKPKTRLLLSLWVRADWTVCFPWRFRPDRSGNVGADVGNGRGRGAAASEGRIAVHGYHVRDAWRAGNQRGIARERDQRAGAAPGHVAVRV